MATFTPRFQMFGNTAKSISALKMRLLDFPAHPTMSRLQTTWMESRTLTESFDVIKMSGCQARRTRIG